jgi:hypothetical protein
MSTVKAANLQNTGSGAPTFKNSSGTEIGQLVKAWINFNGSGTVAIRDDFNVSSLTDNAFGVYTITFNTAFANNDYALVTNQFLETDGGAGKVIHTGNGHDENTTTTAKFRCGTGNQNAAGDTGLTGDVPSVHVVICGA